MTAYTQIATYFEKDSVNEYGEQTFLMPTEINVRWESKTINYIDQKTGKEAISNSIIFCRTELKIDSYIFLGTTAEANPKNINAYVIRRVDNLLGLRNGRTIYKIYL